LEPEFEIVDQSRLCAADADLFAHAALRGQMKTLVSILIPAYNAEHWIRETLLAATNQTWP
jgi:hypothetical protein